MRVFEARFEGVRVLIGVDAKYMKICTPSRIFDLSEISSSASSLSPLPHITVKILGSGETLKISHLTKEEVEKMEETIGSKEKITSEEVSQVIKQDLQLSAFYKNITKEAQGLFYAVFGDRIIENLKDPEIDPGQALSSKKKAKYVLSNPTLVSVFLKMSVTFSEFVAKLFGGFIFLNQAENEVDKMVFLELGRSSCQLERLNVFSFLQQSADRDAVLLLRPPKQGAGARIGNVLNPNLIKNTAGAGAQTEKKKSSVPEILKVPEIVLEKIEQIRKTNVPLEILQRLRETSRLVAKQKKPTEDVEKSVGRIEQIFREETRRTMSEEEGEFAIHAVNRIVPSRFIRNSRGQNSQ